MNKKYLLIFSAILIGSAAFSQDVKKKIDAQAKDPATKKNAAKADVFIQNKHLISDTAVHFNSANTPSKQTAVTIIKRKKHSKHIELVTDRKVNGNSYLKNTERLTG